MAFGAIVSGLLAQVNAVVRVPAGLCLVSPRSGTSPIQWIRGVLGMGGVCTSVIGWWPNDSCQELLKGVA